MPLDLNMSKYLNTIPKSIKHIGEKKWLSIPG